MSEEVIDIQSFMQVIGATRDIEDGIEFPGYAMYNKQPVQSQGVTKAQLMQSRELAEQWYQSVRGLYERQKEEADHIASGPDLSAALARREDRDTDEPRAPSRAEAGTAATLEEELQARQARWTSVAEQAKADAEKAMAAYEMALKQLAKVEAALDAVRGS